MNEDKTEKLRLFDHHAPTKFGDMPILRIDLWISHELNLTRLTVIGDLVARSDFVARIVE